MKNASCIKYSHSKCTSLHGFSLLELTIVITIISLVVGGAFVGKNLIANSKLRSVAMEQARLVKATKMFQDKYFALPGDTKNAQALWGTASGGCPAGARTGTQTCDGTGNAKVMTSAFLKDGVTGVAAADQAWELFTFWQHLSISGMVEESYSGVKTTGTYGFTAGTNVPKTAWVGNAGWNVLYVGIKAADGTYYDGTYGHILMLGDTGFDSTTNSIMAPEEQMRLDAKFDDGLPQTGNIRATKGTYMGSCVTGTAYAVATTTHECAPIWITGF